MTRVGIVGAGNVAARHADVLSGFPDVTIAGIADTDPHRAEALASKHGSPAYGGHADLLSAGGLDAVYVCVPPFAHGNPEHDVLSCNLPLFVEKPLSLDLQTAEKIATEIERRSLPSAVGHHWRYLDIVEQARDLLSGRPVRLALGHWLDKVPPVGWWLKREMSGGQIVEQAVHVLDLARLLVGEVEMVHAVPAGDSVDGEVDRATSAVMRFAGGASGLLATSCLLTRKHRVGLEVCAEGIALELSETRLLVDGERAIEDDGRAKTRVDREFINAVQGRAADVRVPYGEALRTHRVALALARSATERRPVTLHD
ncbi:Gfo/Idh/MocA family protein [Nonomuraea fuscirosea]|jgi:UDP-N-acetylglucosamine 3-dehydrogenase|uniref:Putative dehydrogenase n=1 Tax=Nonomuraea fuscirosea TaxID=1291556 RepID=A0A2T0MMY3_9ACTN|nr:Gfo/Idh/MocA family oxidoreductase [Nonomuraea fuscirosea]PRX59262.1 putative dehydrogenase [Nonomuraea fuscirosea]WSA49848.1 Gfo/Idh/MocA family oxidoreductase [Nonomuraea fuscirosea]